MGRLHEAPSDPETRRPGLAELDRQSRRADLLSRRRGRLPPAASLGEPRCGKAP